MRVCVFEGGGFGDLAPLSLTRPVFDLRCGATTLRERQARWFGAQGVSALVPLDRAALSRLVCPDVELTDPAAPLQGPIALVNARWLPPSAVAAVPPERGVYLTAGEVAYAVLSAADARDRGPSQVLDGLAAGLPQRAAEGVLVRYPWELVEHNAAALALDAAHRAAVRAAAPVPSGVTVVGPPGRVWLDASAVVEPHVVLDTTGGPILIDGGAVVQAFSRLGGPCYVGPRTQLLAARVKATSIGPDCRVGGEVESTIIQGYTNKAHEGFLGHSYVGEWVNLGAGTVHE
jgi:hypothetical protein